MNKKLTISTKDEKVPLPAAVRGSKTPVLKLSNVSSLTSVTFGLIVEVIGPRRSYKRLSGKFANMWRQSLCYTVLFVLYCIK